MATNAHTIAELNQHSDALQDRILRVRLLQGVLQFLYSAVDDMTPHGSVEGLELNQLRAQLSRAADTCNRVIVENSEYMAQDQEVIHLLQVEAGTDLEVSRVS